ncbi:ThiF family adenylyltransferase [Amycolatopsis keratiniphila]|uniref:Dinucleotide-utilizing protein n=1 Tax=Amycolatopsis keratiniphila subsp. keratiniphila TaxID=227715 RepID=A0A1W2LGI9_9PSEU|nr:ThiF family adenylyltransferase [Amycolatopsis keratiniphila]ONF61742.1 dinucleotide-utilizing protein [Amycolatopsis keratiniphila subsp. keratiniphila]
MERPRIKVKHRPVRLDDGHIRIGGHIPGIGTTIRDPDGWVWALLSILDGTRTVDQIITELVHRFPARPPAEVAAEAVGDLRVLTETGYVEDASETTPPGLSAREQERYSRSRELWRWMARIGRRSSWDTQLLLRQARVVVIGVGGTGSTAAVDLALSGVGELHCVEPDVVELSNLGRQILFTEHDLGRPKVEAVVRELRARNSDIQITGQALTVTGPAALIDLAVRFDLVVLAADQPTEIRTWTNRVCDATGTAWVHAGYHGPQINYGLYRPGTGPCYECIDTTERERRLETAPPAPVTALQEVQAGNAVSAGVSGNLAAHAAMSLITGVPDLAPNREYAFNLVTLDGYAVSTLDAPRPGCPACGPHTATA